MNLTARNSRLSSPHRTYTLHTLGWMGFYAAIHLLAIAGVFDVILGTPAAWLLALAAAVPIAGQLRAYVRWMNQSDEYQRALAARCFIVSAGAAMALCSAWGFGEAYAAAPHLPVWLVVPLFWGISGVVAPFVRSSR